MIPVQLSEISEVIQVCLPRSLRWLEKRRRILSFVPKLLSPVPSKCGGEDTQIGRKVNRIQTSTDHLNPCHRGISKFYDFPNFHPWSSSGLRRSNACDREIDPKFEENARVWDQTSSFLKLLLIVISCSDGMLWKGADRSSAPCYVRHLFDSDPLNLAVVRQAVTTCAGSPRI